METYYASDAPNPEHARRLAQQLVQRLQLVVHRDTQRHERARGRVYPLSSGANPVRPSHYASEILGIKDRPPRPPFHNLSRDFSAQPLLTEPVDQIRQLPLWQLV